MQAPEPKILLQQKPSENSKLSIEAMMEDAHPVSSEKMSLNIEEHHY